MGFKRDTVRSETVLVLLRELGDMLTAAQAGTGDFFAGCVQLIQKVLKVEGCSIFMRDPDRGVLRIKAAAKIPPAQWPSISISPGEGIVGRVAESGEMLQVRNAEKFKRGLNLPQYNHYTTSSFMSVPVQLRGETIGVINVDSKSDGSRFSRTDGLLLQGIADVLALIFSRNCILEERLRISTHFDSILQSMPIGVITFDKSMRLTHCNRAAGDMLGMDFSNKEGVPAQALFPDYMRPRVIELITELRVTGIASCTEVELTGQPGERPRPLGISAWSMDQSNGLREGVVLIFEDLSLRRELTELRQVSDLKSHFLSLISHELRTPLTSVIGSVHLLKKSDQYRLDPCQHRIIGIIERNSHRLASIVEDILEVQRIETEDTQLKLEPVDLEILLREGLNCRLESWKDKNIQAELTVCGAPLILRLDHDRTRQIIKHMLDNAFKFCKINGGVWVDAARKSDRIEVRIANSGPTIPMKYRDQIFEKFYQIESTMTRQFGGPGLGLYLARKLARMHGGDVVLELSTEEKTVFLAAFPIIADETVREADQVSEASFGVSTL